MKVPISRRKVSQAFYFLWKGTKDSWEAMLKALWALICATLILWIVFWIAEGNAQPEQYGKWYKSLVWAFSQYIGDPGNFSGPGPVTVTGRLVADIIGVINILIFALPAGIIGAGYTHMRHEEEKKQEMRNNAELIRKRFRKRAQTLSRGDDGNSYWYVPRFYALVTLQLRTGITTDKIIEAVNFAPDMRLVNLANTQRSEDKPADRLAVTVFPVNNEYGCLIDRGADVTIVSPCSCTQIAIGNVAYSLAAMGGFNYVSRELMSSLDEPYSFYAMSESKLKDIDDVQTMESIKAQRERFLNDLKQLKRNSEERGRRHWFIFLLATTKGGNDGKMHFWHLLKEGSAVMAVDEAAFMAIYDEAHGKLAKRQTATAYGEMAVGTTLDDDKLFKRPYSTNVMERVKKTTDCNCFTIRITYDIVADSSRHLLVVKDLADAIRNHVAGQPEPDQKFYAERGPWFLDEKDEPIKLPSQS